MNHNYEGLLDKIKMTELQVQYFTHIENVLNFKVGDYYIDNSDINGLGVFADRDFKEGESIGFSMLCGTYRTDLGRFVNHSEEGRNVYPVKTNQNDAAIIALRDIKKGEEILSDYYENLNCFLDMPMNIFRTLVNSGEKK